MKNEIEELKLYLSTEQSCSYLDNKDSASLFVDPGNVMTANIYSVLINHGFRRSADFVYRPHCPACTACQSTRIPVQEFSPNRNQKRIWKKNVDITVSIQPSEFNESHFSLYTRYMNQRHPGGEMDHEDKSKYMEFFSSKWSNTMFMEFKLDDKVVAIAVTDQLSQGLSALYTFFEPSLKQRSLGTYAILCQIEKARALKMPWLYMGYWIKDCNKMQYKSQFKPIEILHNNQWQRL